MLTNAMKERAAVSRAVLTHRDPTTVSAPPAISNTQTNACVSKVTPLVTKSWIL